MILCLTNELTDEILSTIKQETSKFILLFILLKIIFSIKYIQERMFKSIDYQEGTEKLNLISGFAYKNQIIGQGSFAQVYEGVDQTTGETVALKFIKGEDLERANRLGLISNQVKTLKRLKGKQNILQWYCCAHQIEEICLVTQFCGKGTLKNILKKQPLTLSQKMDFILQINRGYQQIAKAKIIHRDLKPSNILLTSNKVVKIGDFGFAMFLDDLTENNKTRVGSAHYMAPEVLNKFQYSIKSDIWSLGVIFYQILTGKKPWQLKSSRKIYELIKQNQISKLLQVENNNIPVEIRNLIQKMLNFQVQNRVCPDELNFVLSTIQSKDFSSQEEKKPKIETKNIVKKLVSIIDFCRINYYLRCIVQEQTKNVSKSKFSKYFKTPLGRRFKSYLSETIFSELLKTQELYYLTELEREQFQQQKQFLRIKSIVKAYREKYLPSYTPSKVKERTFEEILCWLHDNISEESPYMMLILFDYCLSIYSIKKKLQADGINDLIKKCSMTEISGKLKQEYMEKAKNSNRPIRIEDLYNLKRKFKISTKH